MEIQQEFYELLAFMSSSALGCIHEPAIYGPLRMVDAMSRLIRFADHAGIAKNTALEDLADRIDRDKNLCMTDESAFSSMVQDAALTIVDNMK